MNTTDGDLLFVRAQPFGDILTRLEDGTPVTLLDGPQEAEGLLWWYIQTADGIEGWSAQNDGITQLLVPATYSSGGY